MKKGKQLMNRVLSSLLALALVLTGLYIPEVTAQAADPEDGLVVYYDFVSQNDQAAEIPDASNHGKKAVIEAVSGGARGKYRLVDENIYGKEVKALDLVGGEDGAYLLLPEGILNGCEAVTISAWVKLSTDNGYQRIWDLGSGQGSYMTLLSDGWNKGFEGYAVNINHDGSGEIGVSKGVDENGDPINIDKNRWVLTTVVMDGSVMSLYENGQLVGTKDTGISVTNLWDSDQNFIAYSQFYDEPTTGRFAEFKIYNRALTEAEVADMYQVTDEEIVKSDIRDLDLGDLSNVTEDLTLPSQGICGSDITWSSSNKNVLAIGRKNKDGNYVAKINRPAMDADDMSVTLTAHLNYMGEMGTKDFAITIKREYNDQEMTDHDLAAALKQVEGISPIITKSITLPGVGEWGSDITWTWTGTDGTITIPEKDADGNITAAVVRPAIGQADAAGKLKITVSNGTAKSEQEIDIVVKALRASNDIKGVEAVTAETLAGHSPSLPNYVTVTYQDNTTGKMKVKWPDSIDEENYKTAGTTFEVEGQIVGENETLKAKATVTVVSEETAATAKAVSFDLNDITLDKIGEDGSILTQNRDRDIVYLKLLDNKRMLYDFYMTFGEDDKIKDVQPLGGWDEPTGLLRGHSTGHYMSALALAYASTGDEELKTKLNEMVSELHRLQQKSEGDPRDFKIYGETMEGSLDVNKWSKDPKEWGVGFLSAYSPDQFALLEVYAPYGSPGGGIWAPYYTLHKLLAGFLDAYTYTGNEEALETALALGKWAYLRLSACSQEQLTKMWGMYIAGELGGMNESMAQLYLYAKAKNNPEADIYLAGAKLFDNTIFFDNLAKNLDDIKGRHANQHIPQIVGALKIYDATVAAGEPEQKYYDIAKNFWQMAVPRYAYSTGGVGVGEAFSAEPYAQANNIRGDSNCETCAAYNMMKLTMDLNNYDPDNAEYMDYYERTLYNQILASQTPYTTSTMHNGTTYMLPIGPGVRRDYGGDYTSFSCCHGTGMENHVKYQEAAYAKSNDTLYVGLYLPSTVTWEEKGVKVVQETIFPSETTKLTVQANSGNTAAAQAFNMKLRVPYWATNGFTVKVNGTEKVANPEISTYVELKDVKAGDVIEINMPWTLHLDKTPDKIGDSDVASVMYGPYVMAANHSSSDWLRLVVPGHMEDVVKIGKNEENGFPTLSVGGYNLAPMFAPEFAVNPYHAYFKVLQTADDGSEWYEVQVTNKTPLNGTVESTAQAEMVKSGEDLEITVKPNSGYVTKQLIVNGEAVTATNGKYTVENVQSNVTVEVIFRPAELNLKNLEYSADLSSNEAFDYYGDPTAVMQDWEPTSSTRGENDRGVWICWWTGPGMDSYLQYDWDEPITVNTFNVYWRVSSKTDSAWCHVPGKIRIQYLKDGEWADVNLHNEYEDMVKLDQYNTITFDEVETTAVKMILTTYDGPNSDAGASGVYRWKVSYEVDNSALDEAIKSVDSLTEDDYTAESWKNMQAKLAEAKAALTNAKTQEEIDTAKEALNSAIDALVKKPVEREGLHQTILAAKDTNLYKEENYTAGSWAVMQAVLKISESVHDKADATQAEVDNANKALETALSGLVEKEAETPAAVKDGLRQAIETAKNPALYKEEDYTAGSWAVLKAILKVSESVYDKADATQAEVDNAHEALGTALNGLVKKETDTPSAAKELLGQVIGTAKNSTLYQKDDYTADSWSAMQTALTAAEAIYDKKDAAQAEVDTATVNLGKALMGLVKKEVIQKPGTPTSVNAVWTGAKNVKITWKAAKNATKYKVYRSYSKNGKYVSAGSTTKTSFTDKKATPGKTAYYKVIAYNGNVNGSYSSIKSVYILKAPAGLKVSAKKSGNKGNVTVSFQKSKNASGYAIYRATKKNGTYRRVATLNSKTVKKVFKNVSKGTYYYKVRAYSGTKKAYTAYTSPKKVVIK